MSRGGLREGAGRKLGVPNKNRADFIAILKDKSRVELLVEKLMELAEGVRVQDAKENVYRKPPDASAITYLLDQAFGRAGRGANVLDDAEDPIQLHITV
jgi:hypothetical protein